MRHKKSGFIDRLSGFSRCKPIFITPASFYYIVQFLPVVFLDFDILPHCDAKGGAEKKKSIEKQCSAGMYPGSIREAHG